VSWVAEREAVRRRRSSVDTASFSMGVSGVVCGEGGVPKRGGRRRSAHRMWLSGLVGVRVRTSWVRRVQRRQSSSWENVVGESVFCGVRVSKRGLGWCGNAR
jgi:hypothetical protein